MVWSVLSVPTSDQKPRLIEADVDLRGMVGVVLGPTAELAGLLADAEVELEVARVGELRRDAADLFAAGTVSAHDATSWPGQEDIRDER